MDQTTAEIPARKIAPQTKPNIGHLRIGQRLIEALTGAGAQLGRASNVAGDL
jgi:hypothetical protein